MIRAADRFAEAAEQLTVALNRFLLFQERYSGNYEPVRGRDERLPGEMVLGFLGAGKLSDEEASRLARNVVHRARREPGREPEMPAPGRDEIVRWWRSGDPSNDIS